MEKVMVSIVCTSYNYGQYISQAIDSFLAQKTTFLYEILLIDDCSTDDSLAILQDYQARFPEKIRVFTNEINLGPTKTWIRICQEAKGQYIARCDADDYWIDDLKLQKQYDLLMANPQAKWCNTDCHIVDESGSLIHEHVFKNQIIPLADTYEKLLATKGMTLPSSWLVETKLMQEVNQMIDPTSVDDTFPMQLEFYQTTPLVHLSEPAVAYRMTINSDSRPQSDEKISYRLDGLLATQLDYLDKYPERDMQAIAKIQARHDAWQEKRIFDFNQELVRLKDTLKELTQEREHFKDLYQASEEAYNRVIGSRRWIIPTKILNIFRRNK